MARSSLVCFLGGERSIIAKAVTAKPMTGEAVKTEMKGKHFMSEKKTKAGKDRNQKPELTEDQLSKIVGGGKKSTGSSTTTTPPK